MPKKKIITVIGTRPQFIKAAVLSRLFRNCKIIEEKIVHTGQHFDKNMSEIFFDQLNIPSPTFNLEISGNTHGKVTGLMLDKLDSLLDNEKPDAVLVYGDTNSTLAGALSATKMHIPVFHAEAGLRSFNKKMPEEINRILTDHVSNLLFCPTRSSVDNLLTEGIHEGIHFVGDVMYDATLYAKAASKNISNLEKFGVKEGKYALVTVHRAENTDFIDSLSEILEFLRGIERNEHIDILFPLHPRTKQALKKFNLNLSDFKVCEPVSYFDMQLLLSHAKLVLTDSGGLQKEAYFHRTPCITLRNETEWSETIDSGWNQLWKDKKIIKPKKEISDYGNGNAGEKIYQIIYENLGACSAE